MNGRTTHAVNSDPAPGRTPEPRRGATLRRWWGAYCSLAGACATAAVLLVALDTAFGLRPQSSFSGSLDAIPYYTSRPWTTRFVADQDGIASAKVDYQPFTVWRRPRYASDTVNVDADGRRVVPGSRCDDGAFRVFFFGGSTMWGTSAPDEGTIPALFLREVGPRQGNPLCVRNYGESAWVSSQSVIALMTALQRGDIPDLVIFYEGANDLNWTFGNDTPYRHAEYDRIAAIFGRAGRGRGQGRRRTVDVSGLLRALAPNITSSIDRGRQWGRGPSDRSPEGLERLAGEAIGVYLANQRIVRSLAEEYGFRCRFFWQPYLIYGRKPLAAGEARILDGAASWATSFRLFAAAANARIAAVQADDFTDLSGVFAETGEQIYTDMVHMTPEGNAIVARAMITALGDQIPDTGSHSSGR